MNDSWFEKNLAVLSQRQPREAEILAAIAVIETGDGYRIPLAGGEAVLGMGQNDWPALTLDLGGGPKRLTSGLDPRKEDQRLAEQFLKTRPLTKGLTVIGFGLGYHLDVLVEKLAPEEPLWLWEGRPELAAAALRARDLRPILKEKRFRLCLANTLPPEAPRTILARPANLRLDGQLYPAAVKKTAPKPPRILFLSAGYYLGREIPWAARSLKAQVKTWSPKPSDNDPINNDPTNNELANNDPKKTAASETEGERFKTLLMELKQFQPELVITVNHLGLDEDGIVASVFQRLGVPIASWFVDSPVYILRPGPQSDVFVFSWDADYVEWLKLQGFGQVDYLPLATDPAWFAPQTAEIVRGVAFVGDSLAAATDKYLAQSGLTKQHLPQVDHLAKNFLKNADLIPNRLTSILAEREKLTYAQTRALWALVTWRASRLSRQKVLKGVDNLVIRGDEGWRELLPTANLSGGLDYYQELAPFYRSSAINLNVTSSQMKNGVNQRIFDVPAAGGFLLTDAKNQLSDLFAPDEIATYQSPAEARSLVESYLKRPRERQTLIQKAQARIFGEHQYVHRLEKIFQRVFGRP
ncbi:MAG: glycosyltransferase [Deltaproteobacteria bacterium]|nr:glycosyltransferase [Deltaproteobacteria bacterium]